MVLTSLKLLIKFILLGAGLGTVGVAAFLLALAGFVLEFVSTQKRTRFVTFAADATRSRVSFT
jgi:hypothetical protein